MSALILVLSVLAIRGIVRAITRRRRRRRLDVLVRGTDRTLLQQLGGPPRPR